MTNQTITNAQAKQDKLFYIVATIIIINKTDATCLLLKRSQTEKVHPGKWAFPGGKLEHKDVADLLTQGNIEPIDGVEDILSKLAVREAYEECGLTINEANIRITRNKVFIRPDGVPVFLAVLVTEYQQGSIVLEEGAFTDSAWVSKQDLANYDCILGIPEEAIEALDLV